MLIEKRKGKGLRLLTVILYLHQEIKRKRNVNLEMKNVNRKKEGKRVKTADCHWSQRQFEMLVSFSLLLFNLGQFIRPRSLYLELIG